MKVPSGYRRHFFLPTDWLSLNANSNGFLFRVTVQRDVLFAKGGELVVVKRGLVEGGEIVGFGGDDDDNDDDGGGGLIG